MTPDKLDPDLKRLCAELERGARRNLRSARSSHLSGGVLAALAVTVVGTGGAAAAGLLSTSPEHVAAGMPAGSTIFGNADPECTLDDDEITYHCTVGALTETSTGYCPTRDGEYIVLGTDQRGCERAGGEWVADRARDHTGQRETVAIDGRVAGGCIGRDREGRSWDCYLGDEAVARDIISRDLLGERQPAPVSG